MLGKSGTGKSVLLRLLIGLEKADAGSICIRGQETTNLQMDQLNEMRLKVGFLFQEGALYDSLTIAENVAFPLRRHTKMSDSERQEKVRALLNSVGLDKDLDKMPGLVYPAACVAKRRDWREHSRWTRRSCCSTSLRRG